MAAVVHAKPYEARRRLIELCVPIEALTRAIEAGRVGRSLCTDNDPPIIPGTEAWRYVVRKLREELVPKGWRKADPANYSLVINDAAQLNIVVASADEFVCRAHADPRTRSPKGLYTAAAIARNTVAGDLFPETLDEDVRFIATALQYPTWMLLIHITDQECRGELSFPDLIEDQKIVSWAERIFIPHDDADSTGLSVPDSDEGPDFDVPVRRKA